MPVFLIFSSLYLVLPHLHRLVARFGDLADQQFAAAIDSLENRDVSSFYVIIAGDTALDLLEQELNDRAIEVIATRAPMARDLRSILSAVKIASVLERVGDYAKNIAKRIRLINLDETNRSDTITLARILVHVQVLLRQVFDPHATGHAHQPIAV